MQVHRKRMRVSATLLTLALAATACGGDDGGDGGDGGTAAGEGTSGGSFSLYIGEPENPLVPTNTSETEGGQVVDALFTGLVQYDPDTTEQIEGVAESIESEDSRTWTITLKDWTFHDGTPVTSDSFINAWNYGANSANAQGGSYFFANIEGYDDLQGVDGAPPASTEMSGLRKIDDQTFEVVLKEPFRQYPITLGYTAFSPQPEAFFAEGGAEAMGTRPIGNGPFQAETDFVPGQGITMSRYEDYSGEELAMADEVEFRVYAEMATAFTDVQAGNLDFSDVPPDAITTFKDEFGDRAIERETSTFQYLGFPTYDARFDDPRVRQAFSMAIDRAAIAEAIFNGTRLPAASVISPVVDGHRPDACGEYCEYDPEAAAALLAETDFDTSQPVDLWFNAGGGHDEWVQAVGNNLRDNLDIEYTLQGSLQFAEYLPLADSQGFTGPFRLGWAMDYPSPQNYLEPLYSTEALPPNGSNTAFYSNPDFDRLVDEGNRAETNEEAVQKYQEAEDVLLQDMPIMPMFFSEGQYVHSERISNVKVDAFSNVVLEDVTVNE